MNERTLFLIELYKELNDKLQPNRFYPITIINKTVSSRILQLYCKMVGSGWDFTQYWDRLYNQVNGMRLLGLVKIAKLNNKYCFKLVKLDKLPKDIGIKIMVDLF